MKKTLDLTAYFPAKGSNKAYYRKVGNLFIGDDGRISAKLDSVPVGMGWEGWLNAFEKRDEAPRSSSSAITPPALTAAVAQAEWPDDDIPF